MNTDNIINRIATNNLLYSYIPVIKYFLHEDSDVDDKGLLIVYINFVLNPLFMKYELSKISENIDDLRDDLNELAEKKVETLEQLNIRGNTKVFDEYINELDDNSSFIGHTREENILAGQSEAYYQLDNEIFELLIENI